MCMAPSVLSLKVQFFEAQNSLSDPYKGHDVSFLGSGLMPTTDKVLVADRAKQQMIMHLFLSPSTFPPRHEYALFQFEFILFPTQSSCSSSGLCSRQYFLSVVQRALPLLNFKELEYFYTLSSCIFPTLPCFSDS